MRVEKMAPDFVLDFSKSSFFPLSVILDIDLQCIVDTILKCIPSIPSISDIPSIIRDTEFYQKILLHKLR